MNVWNTFLQNFLNYQSYTLGTLCILLIVVASWVIFFVFLVKADHVQIYLIFYFTFSQSKILQFYLASLFKLHPSNFLLIIKNESIIFPFQNSEKCKMVSFSKKEEVKWWMGYSIYPLLVLVFFLWDHTFDCISSDTQRHTYTLQMSSYVLFACRFSCRELILQQKLKKNSETIKVSEKNNPETISKFL